jgi:hypothetical protein
MSKRIMSYLALASLVIAAIFLTLLVRLQGRRKRIPNGPFHRWLPQSATLVRYHPVDYSKPVPHVPVPQHPFMAPNPGSNMHCDAYISDTYEASGPMGFDPRVMTRTEGFGGYGTITFDSRGRLVAVYGNGRDFKLQLLDPRTFEEMASYKLPSRSLKFFFSGIRPWEYLGAGMYFYLDNDDCAVVPTTRNTVQVVQAPDLESRHEFKLVREYDLRDHVVPGTDDSAAFVLPDWSGVCYWYATTEGIVGTIDRETGAVQKIRLEGELVENSFAVGEDGVFIISDQAMYRFNRESSGKIVIDWRTEYPKAPQRKAGHISVGSGTSTSLAGGRDGMVVIADNAQPRINALFIRRSDGLLVGKVPLFADGKSGTDLTAIALEHADGNGKGTGVYTGILENNWGHHTFPFSRPEPGLTRVDATRHEDGTYTCEEVWASQEKTIGGFRLSLGNGLVYIYGKEGSGPGTKWYLTAIDFATGSTVFRQLAGTGLGYNNWQGSLFLHPDGMAISTTIFGAVMVGDMAPQA